MFTVRNTTTANYRIDRTEDVEVLNEKISDTASKLRSAIAGYTKQVWKKKCGGCLIYRKQRKSILV